VRGELSGNREKLQLKISGTKDVLDLAADPKNTGAYDEAGKKVGQSVIVEGVMLPGKDLKAAVPLQIREVRMIP
jgi:hypothetical protein